MLSLTLFMTGYFIWSVEWKNRINFMSMPPLVKWDYDYKIVKEAKKIIYTKIF